MNLAIVLYVLFSFIIFKLVVTAVGAFKSPLRSVPGPFWARFTDFYYFRQVATAQFEKENIRLHRKHGAVVRLGPNTYSIDSPAAVKTIYSTGSKFAKSSWYDTFKHPSPEEWTLFPLRDMKKHSEERRKFQTIYSLSSLVNYEPYVDHCTSIFFQRLTEISVSGKVIDMGHWLQCYAFDVIAYLTFQKRFGFLDNGEDIGGLMKSLDTLLRYSSLFGIYAWLHPIAFNITSRFKSSSASGRYQIASFVKERIEELRARSKDPEKLREEDVDGPQCIIEKMMTAHQTDPGKVTQRHVFKAGLFNITAGSDTTAVSLSAILYHLLKNPEKLQKLRAEIDDFERRGLINSSAVSFKVTQSMPYLQAVIKEGMRMHAATGLPLWRVVPEGGAELDGYFFPAGTVVGINTWCAHYNGSIFENPNSFVPERWIEGSTGDSTRSRQMDTYYFPFGLGSRICLGKHISNLEMSKLIPRLVREFDFEMEEPEKSWKTTNFWFVKPRNFRVKIKARLLTE